MAQPSRRKRVLWILAIAVLLMVALTAAWRWTPLHEYAEPRVVASFLRTMASSPWLPLFIAAVYIGSTLVMFPQTVLTVATILALGSWKGFAYATGGAMVAAIVGYAVARSWSPGHARSLKWKPVEKVGEALKRGSVAQVAMLRLMPIAPFGVVNFMAGIAHVRVIPYVVGSLIGLLPGNLLLTAFGRQLRRMFQDPQPVDVAGLVAVVVVMSLAMWWLHKVSKN